MSTILKCFALLHEEFAAYDEYVELCKSEVKTELGIN